MGPSTTQSVRPQIVTCQAEHERMSEKEAGLRIYLQKANPDYRQGTQYQ